MGGGMTAPADVLQEVFGFAHFRPGQADVIAHVLAGRSAAAVFPTGSGTSLCDQLPALTATATPPVLADICRGFDIAPDCAVRTGFYRQNLTVLTTSIDAANRDAALGERLAQRPRGPTIVYVTLQRTAEAVAATLTAAG